MLDNKLHQVSQDQIEVPEKKQKINLKEVVFQQIAGGQSERRVKGNPKNNYEDNPSPQNQKSVPDVWGQKEKEKIHTRSQLRYQDSILQLTIAEKDSTITSSVNKHLQKSRKVS